MYKQYKKFEESFATPFQNCWTHLKFQIWRHARERKTWILAKSVKHLGKSNLSSKAIEYQWVCVCLFVNFSKIADLNELKFRLGCRWFYRPKTSQLCQPFAGQSKKNIYDASNNSLYATSSQGFILTGAITGEVGGLYSKYYIEYRVNFSLKINLGCTQKYAT